MQGKGYVTSEVQKGKFSSFWPASKKKGLKAPGNSCPSSVDLWHDGLPSTNWRALWWGWSDGVHVSGHVCARGSGTWLVAASKVHIAFPSRVEVGCGRGLALRDGCLLWPDKALLYL